KRPSGSSSTPATNPPRVAARKAVSATQRTAPHRVRPGLRRSRPDTEPSALRPGRYVSGRRASGPYAPTFPFCHKLRMNADNKSCSLDVDSEYVELALELFSMLA